MADLLLVNLNNTISRPTMSAPWTFMLIPPTEKNLINYLLSKIWRFLLKFHSLNNNFLPLPKKEHEKRHQAGIGTTPSFFYSSEISVGEILYFPAQITNNFRKL